MPRPSNKKPQVQISFPPNWNQNQPTKRKLFQVGRPRAFASALELEDEIDKYFEWCEENKKMPTVVGMSLFLNISDETWRNYRKEDHDYFGSIKKAERLIEEAWAQNLKWGQAGGSIFYLKNKFGYRDVVENPSANNTINFIMPPEIASKYGLMPPAAPPLDGNADVVPAPEPPQDVPQETPNDVVQ